MSEIREYGYQELRNFIQENWKYIELQDSAGNPIIRLGVGDSRVTWVHSVGSQTLSLQIVVTGADVGATTSTPKEFAKSAIFNVASGGQPISVEDFAENDVTVFSNADSKLTHKHDLQVPRIV
ncbi:hypothetical protein [Bacillus subtilis]|uniref:hypothetical protein n=1 Tax=Bacillus subtilis TaxID=1423 RepID=UPI0013BB1C02|nr:hypothetical protein [Bacillus subtilis]KAF2425580.1 hypothetical protein B6K89_09155 [Bacillus subtilis]